MICRRLLLSLMLLTAPLISSSARFQNRNQARAVAQGSIALCRQTKAAEKNYRFRDPGGLTNCPRGVDCFKGEPAWYFNLHFFKRLTVADDEGHRDTFPFQGPGDMMPQTVSSVTYTSECPTANCMMVIMYVNRSYELTFTPESEVMLDLVKGVGNDCPDEAIRYLGELIPDGATARLRITPHGVEDLRYDKSGNGDFSLTVKPTSHTFAPAAWDTRGPYLKISQQVQDANTLLIHIAAEDESGVKSVIYTIDDSKVYYLDKPIKVDRARPHLIRAVADDVLGNRGGMYEYTTKP